MPLDDCTSEDLYRGLEVMGVRVKFLKDRNSTFKQLADMYFGLLNLIFIEY